VVQDPGKTLHAVTCKPVNTPEPVPVAEDGSGLPLAVRCPRRQTVVAVEDRWRLDDEWWRQEPVSRLYYAALLASGERLVLYKDLTGGGWYRQSC
jgi:hypothetical protein